jgi:hypothetical protein
MMLCLSIHNQLFFLSSETKPSTVWLVTMNRQMAASCGYPKTPVWLCWALIFKERIRKLLSHIINGHRIHCSGGAKCLIQIESWTVYHSSIADDVVWGFGSPVLFCCVICIAICVRQRETSQPYFMPLAKLKKTSTEHMWFLLLEVFSDPAADLHLLPLTKVITSALKQDAIMNV